MTSSNSTGSGWLTILKDLYAGDWDPTLGRYRAQVAYRGVKDASWEMETSLMRLGGGFPALERHLIRNFRKYAHRDVVDRDSFWYWLSVAQHHGLPTRLLDWTYSPFVALHFVTDDLTKMDVDGAVWVVDLPSAHSRLPSRLKRMLRREGSAVFTIDMLFSLERRAGSSVQDPTEFKEPNKQNLIRNLEDFDKISDQTFALYYEPPSIDDRIVNQFALFSVLSNPSITLNRWLESSGTKFRKVVIPAGLKWEIRDKLDQANITERVIYPGLDGLTQWLRRHYSSSGLVS